MKEAIDKEKLDETELALLIDDFTGAQSILFTKIARNPTQYFNVYRAGSETPYDYISITFVFDNGIWLVFHSRENNFKFQPGDSIVLVSETKEKMDITFGDGKVGNTNNHKYSVELSAEDFSFFILYKFDKLKITNQKKGLYAIYTVNHSVVEQFLGSAQYDNAMEGQYLLNLMAKKFVDFIFASRETNGSTESTQQQLGQQ